MRGPSPSDHVLRRSTLGVGPRAVAVWQRLAACRRGAAAVEFALLATPFFALIFLVLNTTLTFFAQQTLQSATTTAARLILTGQAQAQGMTVAQFQQAVCANTNNMFSCSQIYVNVQTFSSFSNVTPLNPISNGAFSSSNLAFNVGNAGDIVLVQAFYQWPLYATLLGFNFSNLSSGNDLLIASAAFRNEPFN